MKHKNELKALRSHWKPIITQGKKPEYSEYIRRYLIPTYNQYLEKRGFPKSPNLIEDLKASYNPNTFTNFENYIEYVIYRFFERNTNTAS